MEHENLKEKSRIRLFALGGLDEDGKNMMVVQIDEDIYLIEAGLKFPDAKQPLGIEYIVQDFSWLIEHKDQVRACFITHGHDDVMGALPFLVRAFPVHIYATEFTAGQIYKLLKKNRIYHENLHIIKNTDQIEIEGRKVVFFPLTHSYPQAYGLAIHSPEGYLVYSGEFIQDYDLISHAYNSDYTICHRLAQEGVFLLMQDSKGAERPGHTSPAHKLEDKFNKVLRRYPDKRIFITIYTQSVYWIQELIAGCIAYNRKMVFYTKEMQELIEGLESITEAIPRDLILEPDQINQSDNVVVFISGQGKGLFEMMSKIANNETSIRFTEEDLIVVATPLIPGVERAFGRMENDIYKKDGVIIKLDQDVVGMHPAKEDLKMMIYTLQPKYYLPIKGEYRMLCANAMVAEEMGIKPDHILILDNYQVAEFEDGKLVSTDEILELNETKIDGKENWDMAGVVLKDREILANDGVVVCAIGLDAKTHEIINGPDIQTRGVVYLRETEHIVQDIDEIMKEIIDQAAKADEFDMKETKTKIRDKVSKYLYKKTAKRPMVLPVLIELDLGL